MKTSHDSEVPAQGQQVITACAFIHHNFEVSQSGRLAQEVASDFDEGKNRDNLNSPCKGVEKLFLPRRAATKKFLPNKFELPGGHIDFGENIVTGLEREIAEEFGVKIKVGDPFAAFDYANEVKGSHSVEVVYFAQLVDPVSDITLNPEDHSEVVWFDGKDFSEIVTDMGGEDDPEFRNVVRGFELLRGGKINF